MSNKNPSSKRFSSTHQPKKNGRPKGTPNMSTIIKKIWYAQIGKKKDEFGEPLTRAALSVKAIVEKAAEGDINAFKELVNRLEGLPKQTIDQNIRERHLNPQFQGLSDKEVLDITKENNDIKQNISRRNKAQSKD